MHVLEINAKGFELKFHNFRAYIAFKLPGVRLLDFRKIKQKERDEANNLFKSKKGKEMQKEIIRKAKTFVPGGNMPDSKVTSMYYFQSSLFHTSKYHTSKLHIAYVVKICNKL